MMWIITAMYFVVVSGLLLVGFVVYGKTLFFLGRSGAFAKYVGGLLFTCCLRVYWLHRYLLPLCLSMGGVKLLILMWFMQFILWCFLF